MSDEPYTSFGYLDPDELRPHLELAPEHGRVPAYDGGLSTAEAERARRLLTESLVISLHDHPVRFPADMRDTPAYNRTGRQRTLAPRHSAANPTPHTHTHRWPNTSIR